MAAAAAPVGYQDPYGETGPPTSQAADYAPAGGGSPTGQPSQEQPSQNAPAAQPAWRWNSTAGRYDIGGDITPTAAQGAPASAPAEPKWAWNAAAQKYDIGDEPPPEKKPQATSKTTAAAPPEKGFFQRWWDTLNTDIPTGVADSPSGNIKDVLVNPAISGYEKAKQVGAILASPVRSKEDTAASIAAAQGKMAPAPAFIKALDDRVEKEHTVFGVLDAYIENPRTALAEGMQGFVQGGGVLAASSLAGVAGGAPGMIAGAGASGYLDKYGETVLTTLSAHGVDLADKDAVLKALNDPALMSQANAAAAKAGIPAAIINMASFGLMGRIAAPVAGRLGGGILGRTAGATSEVAAQGAIGAGGEAGSQEYTQGRITNPGAVVAAGINQAAITAPGMIGHLAGGHAALEAANAREGAPPQTANAPEAGGAPAVPAGRPNEDPDLVAARTIAAAETKDPEGEAQQARQAQEIAQRNAEDHFQPLPADNLGRVEQQVAPAARSVVEGGPANIIEADQRNAALLERARGGDSLSQVAAAAQAGAETGAHVDAAEVHGAREAEAAHMSVVDQMHRQRALEEQTGLPLDQTAPGEPASLETLWTPEQAQARDTIEQARAKGGATEPAPTLADTLTPAQRQAFDTLRQQRVPPEAPTAPAEAASSNRLALIRAAVEKRAQAVEPPAKPTESAEPAEEAEQPETNPAPVTPATLKARRQAALDAARAEKVGVRQQALKERANAAPAPADATNMPGQPPALAARREAAFQQDANYKTLMTARPEDVGSLVGRMTPDEAQTHLQRLDAAPGDNPVARAALETRAASAERIPGSQETNAPARKTLTLADRAEPVDEQKGRFADSNASAREDVTQASGLELRRRAEAGDPAARSEMDRRLGAQPAAAPETPEQGALADKRARFRDAQAVGREAPPVPREAVRAHLAPLIERLGKTELGEDKLHIHDSLADADVPQSVRDEAIAGNHDDPRGYYDPKTGEMHIFAGSKGHVTAADAANTAVHEQAHEGIRTFLGPDYARVMADVHDRIHNRQTDVPSPIPGKVDKVTAREWLSDYLSQHGYDPTNKAAQSRAADEYIAHLAEQDSRTPGRSENPSLLQHVYDGIRAALRKLGIVKAWTDDDLRRLLRESANDKVSPHAKRAAEYRGDGLRWADSDASDADRYEPDDPRAVSNKFGAAVDQLADHGKGYVVSRMDLENSARDKFAAEGASNWDPEKTREAALSTQTLQSLPDNIDPKLMPSADKFVREEAARRVRAKQLKAPGEAIIKEGRDDWAVKNPDLDRKLQELEWRSTSNRIDPSKGKLEQLYSDDQMAAASDKKRAEMAAANKVREERYPEMRRLYNELDAKGQELYQRKRDALRDLRNAEFDAIDQRAKDLGIAEGPRKDLKTLIEKKLGRGEIEPYFPLSRFGSRWSAAKDAAGGMIYEKFETQKAQNEWEAKQHAAGYNIEGGKDITSRDLMNRADPDFLRDIERATEGISDAGERNNLREEIFQKYLERLSNASIKKHSMRRAGVAGFNKDMWRSFADYVEKSGNVVAQLEHNHTLDQHLQDINEQAKAAHVAARTPGSGVSLRDAQWATSLADEFNKRRPMLDNPHETPLMSAITRYGFGWFLGFSPASAARVWVQNVRNAAPALAAEHGTLQGRRALWRANATRAANHLNNALQLARFQRSKAKGSLTDVLRGDRRLAMEWVRDTGAFSNTQANVLTEAARGRTPAPSYQEIGRGLTDSSLPLGARVKTAAASSFRKTVMEPYVAASRALFQAAEVHNRETTALAGIDLALAQGKSWQEAAWHGMRMTNIAHFDYSLGGRPRAVTGAGMLGSIGKPIGQFRQYDLGQVNRISRDALDAIFNNRNLSGEQRAIAAKRFVQMQITGLALYGAVGVPVLSNIASMIANRVMSIQQGQPVGAALASPEVDAKTMWRAHLTHQFGSLAANSIIDGPASAIFGAALTGSDADAFFRPSTKPNQTWEEDWEERIANMVPALSIPGGMLMGVDQLLKGNTERAFEHFLPIGLSHIAKAVRAAHEGFQSANAVPNEPNAKVATPEELSPFDIAKIAAGFTPGFVANRYESNAAEQAESDQITREKTAIKQHFLNAYAIKDPDEREKEVAKAYQEMYAFNKARPIGAEKDAIEDKDIDAYIKEQYAKGAKSVHGSSPPNARFYLHGKYSGEVGPPPEAGEAPPEASAEEGTP